MRDWTTLRFRSRLCSSAGLAICGLLLAAQTWAQATGEAFVQTAARGDVVSVTSLLGHGTDVDARDRNGNTALIEAARTGKRDVVNALIKAGADPDVRDDQGRPAITLAARKATLDSGVKMIALLISAGADINARDEHDRSPLENAVRISKTEYRKPAVRENVAAAVYALTSRGADDASIAAARWQCRVNDYWLFERMIRDGRRRAESLARQQPDPPAER